MLFYLLPFDNNVAMGQVNQIVLFFITLAWFLSEVKGRHVLAGASLAMAALIKIVPALLLAYFVIQKRYRVVFGFAVGAVAAVVPTMLYGGWEHWVRYVELLPMISYGRHINGLFPPAALENFSIAGFFCRSFDNAQTIEAWSLATIAVLFALCVGLQIWLRYRSAPGLHMLSYLSLMVMTSPLTYYHHMVYLYPAVLYASVFVLGRYNRAFRVLVMLLIIFACGIVSTDFPLYLKQMRIVTTERKWMTSLNLYGLIGLYILGLTLHFVARARKGSKSEEKAMNAWEKRGRRVSVVGSD